MVGGRRRQQSKPPFETVEDLDALERWLSRSGAVLVYLHDPWCPISGRAYRELAPFTGPIPLIDVSADRHLSDAIEERTGIRHESPQAILFVDGEPVWNASHHRISGIAVASALEEHGAIPPEPAT